jgi:peptide/nickel transport system ATP-binding protein
MKPDATPPPLLSIEDLRIAFRVDVPGQREAKRVPAVGNAQQGVSLRIPENTTVALVGESGSGKSVTAMAIVGLLPGNAECQGRILFRGQTLLGAPLRVLQGLRGRHIGCVFQDPLSSLNPVLTIGDQLCEPLMHHEGLSRRQAMAAERTRAAPAPLPAPALGRAAAARDDRHGHGLPPAVADRRRAHHRARRHGAAADPGPVGAPQGAAPHEHALHQP